MRLLLLLCLGFGLPAWADTAPYPDVYPPDATVVVGTTAWPRGQRFPGAPTGKPTHTMTFSHPGYASAVIELTSEDLFTDVPAPCIVRLRADSWSRAVLDRIRYNALPCALGLALALPASLAGWRYLRLRRYGKDDDPLVARRARLGRYRIVARVGQGGMATVYKALPDHNLRDQDAVALKVMNPAYQENDPEAIPRFRREAELAASLVHPSIVRTLEHGEERGLLYLVMELVVGEPLSRRLPPGGFPLDQALGYARPVLDALAYAHSRHIVHRDVKPENVMLAEDGRVLLMDFGVARAEDVTAITRTGMAMGTPSYLPPEQLTGGIINPRSDQYSLGIMLYQLVTGTVPYSGTDPKQVALMHVTETPRSPREVRPDLPAHVERTIMRMISKDPEARFKDLAEVALGLSDPSAFPEETTPLPAAPRLPSPQPAPPGFPPAGGRKGGCPEEGEDTVGVPRIS